MKQWKRKKVVSIKAVKWSEKTHFKGKSTKIKKKKTPVIKYVIGHTTVKIINK